MSRHYHLPVFAAATILAFALDSAAQAPAPIQKQDGQKQGGQKQDGPVQGYQGGYDPIDKSKAPAAPGGKQTDAANADEGRDGYQAFGTVAQIDGRHLTLDSGLVLVVPPTLDLGLLTTGTRIKALYERQEGANVVTGIMRE
jgi:hypothetical protein